MESLLQQPDIKRKIADSIFVAQNLFSRNKVSGSSANLSFRHDEHIFISATGSSFGNLTPNDFSVIDFSGNVVEGAKPSKEFPLHLAFYRKDSKIGAVLHTHSFFSTLWSCLKDIPPNDAVPKYTPYLEMKLGKIGIVPYAPPGSKELFKAMENNINNAAGFLLSHHGPIVPGKNIKDAFFILEELEESCKVAWFMRHESAVETI